MSASGLKPASGPTREMRPTQVTVLNLWERESLQDQIAALKRSAFGTNCLCSECQDLAARDLQLAARLQARPDAAGIA